MLDPRQRGRGFEPYRRHCVVSLSKNINPSLVLVQSRKTRPFITERLLMGCKESNQTDKQSKWSKLCILYCTQNGPKSVYPIALIWPKLCIPYCIQNDQNSVYPIALKMTKTVYLIALKMAKTLYTLLHSKWPKLCISYCTQNVQNSVYPIALKMDKTLYTILHSKWPKLYRVSAILSAIRFLL